MGQSCNSSSGLAVELESRSSEGGELGDGYHQRRARGGGSRGGEKRGGSSQLLLLLKGQAQVCVEPYASMKNRRGGEIKF